MKGWWRQVRRVRLQQISVFVEIFFFFRVHFQLWNIIESFICGPTTTETARERNRLMPYKLCWTLKHFVRIPSNARSD